MADRRGDHMTMEAEMSSAAVSQGAPATTWSQKRPGTDCVPVLPESVRVNTACQHLDFGSVVMILGFWPAEL